MVRGEPFEISKEVYDRAMEQRGYIASCDKADLFPDEILCGYGLYGAMAYYDKETKKYMCAWSHGSSCD